MVGTANVVEAERRLRHADYAAAEQHHRIPPARQERAFTDGWRTPWVLANARPLQKPVRYKHPSGAVIWVNLEPMSPPRCKRSDHMTEARKKLIEVDPARGDQRRLGAGKINPTRASVDPASVVGAAAAGRVSGGAVRAARR